MRAIKKVYKMAAESFCENLVIETEEQCRIILKAFDEADNRADKRPPHPMNGLRKGRRRHLNAFFSKKDTEIIHIRKT